MTSYSNKPENRVPELKQRAKELFTNEHLTAKAISEKTGVSEKTIGKWIKDYGWKASRDNPYQIKDAKVFVHLFQTHLAKHNPKLYLQINNSIIDFLTDYRP